MNVKHKVDTIDEKIEKQILEKFGNKIEENMKKKIEECFGKKLGENIEIDKKILELAEKIE